MYFMVHEDIVTFLAEVYYCLVQTEVKMDNFRAAVKKAI